jgi:hypothetical protein
MLPVTRVARANAPTRRCLGILGAMPLIANEPRELPTRRMK